MAKLNVKRREPYVRPDAPLTHGGALATPDLTIEQQLRRSVCSCLLWEDTFYESGKDIGDRIVELARQANPGFVAKLAIEARTKFNLRHVPLLLVSVLAKTGSGSRLVSDTIVEVVKRADELTEFLAVYAKLNGFSPNNIKLSAQMKLGLARAFEKFDHYQLVKYNRDGVIRMRDVAFLAHTKPANDDRGVLLANLVNRDFFPEATKASGFRVRDRYDLHGKPHLDSADTWEHKLSAGENKKQTFEELLQGGKLGYMALLKNLRGMHESNVDKSLVRDAILARRGAHVVLPFRFLTAAKHAPFFEAELDQALLANLAQVQKLPGKTIFIVDVSGSMYGANMSEKSEMNRAHVACSLAAVAREICEEAVIYATAGNDGTRVHKTQQVPARHGMALIDAIYSLCKPLGGGGIFLKQCIDFVKSREGDAERIVVVTDEQDCSVGHMDSPKMAAPFGRHNYLINVAAYKNGIGYGKWVHLDGFSEHVLRFIAEYELTASPQVSA